MSEKQQILHAMVVPTEPGDDFPKGKWRDGPCDCFSYCCRPVCLNTWFCSSCLLGQVMSRVGLNTFGEPTTAQLARNTFCRVVAIVATIFVLRGAIGASFPTKKICPDNIEDDFFCSDEFVNPNVNTLDVFLQGLLGLYILIIIYRTRSAIRKKSGIVGNGCEDCLCASFCSLCTIGQMARHTADYDALDDDCCSFNGLRV